MGKDLSNSRSRKGLYLRTETKNKAKTHRGLLYRLGSVSAPEIWWPMFVWLDYNGTVFVHAEENKIFSSKTEEVNDGLWLCVLKMNSPKKEIAQHVNVPQAQTLEKEAHHIHVV